eukprot:scaffold24641_cov19-Tisochrysis_lutea.AAC.1
MSVQGRRVCAREVCASMCLSKAVSMLKMSERATYAPSEWFPTSAAPVMIACEVHATLVLLVPYTKQHISRH